MKVFRVLVVTLVVAPACAITATPVQKVITLLENMLTTGKKEKHAESVQFSAYKQFCESTVTNTDTKIEEGAAEIGRLKSKIQQNLVKAAKLGDQITAHDADIDTREGDKKAATAVREIENTEYSALHTDLSESVDAITRAISVLKAQAYDRKQKQPEEAPPQSRADTHKELYEKTKGGDGEGAYDTDRANGVESAPPGGEVIFVQIMRLPRIPADAKKVLASFLGLKGPEGLEVTNPEANAYESRSSSVIDMLDKLHAKFIDQSTNIEEIETKSRHEYDKLMQSIKNEIDTATQLRDERKEAKALHLQKKADGEGDLADTTSTRDEDVRYVTDLTATCEQKASDFANRQQLRAEELVAVQKAIDIIKGGVVAHADKHQAKDVAESDMHKLNFAQLRSEHSESHTQADAAEFLDKQARKLGSRVLAALATRVTASPFKKVLKMIDALITRLIEEATGEASKKGWCDTELATNEHTRISKTKAVESLHAEIDQLETSVAKLSEDITELTKSAADLDAAMAKATKIRMEEKSTNRNTIKDAQAAQTAVAAAINVLQDFYAKAGDATSLIQQKNPEAPEIFDEPYKGMGGESGGVIGMLEVIDSDFARLEAETTTGEAEAQKEYESFMTESKVDRAAKSKDAEHKTAKRERHNAARVGGVVDLESTEKELTAAMAYFDKLKPSCIETGLSYEDRVIARKEEIASLQDALRILNGEEIAM